MPENSHHILILDDDVDVLNAARLLLKQHVAQVDVEQNPKYLESMLRKNSYDALLLDMNFTEDVASGEEGFRWLKRVRDVDPALSVILITAYGDVEKAVHAMKNGATDFVTKPWQNEKLVATVSSAIRLTRSRREVDTLRGQQQHLSEKLDHQYQNMIGHSDPMQRVFKTIEKVASTDANVLILGENGTGKELVARALHRRSHRKNSVFISVDMGAIPDNLFESELFGHTKGAFTDAVRDKPGRFEIASGGTLFLDEIGNLPLHMQSKLLSVLESRSVTRVGSTQTRPIDIRLVSATNSSIHQMVKEQKFRQDLLYRINTIEIKLPPLRNRKDDIPLLATYFLNTCTEKYHKKITGISKVLMEKLCEYEWPGNVRELQHTIERAVIMAEGAELSEDDFLFHGKRYSDESFSFADYTLEELEKMAVEEALKKYKGNISRTAEELGLTRASLYRRMEKYGL